MEINKGPAPFESKAKKKIYFFDRMDVGDWFMVEGLLKAESAQNAGYSYGQRTKTGFRLSRRKSPDHEDTYCLVRVK